MTLANNHLAGYGYDAAENMIHDATTGNPGDVIADSAGNIKSESDYYPYGGELPLLSNDSSHYKHNGKERDAETGAGLLRRTILFKPAQPVPDSRLKKRMSLTL